MNTVVNSLSLRVPPLSRTRWLSTVVVGVLSQIIPKVSSPAAPPVPPDVTDAT